MPMLNAQTGKVYLVGAGPGDAGLITVRGLRCLEMADVVLYDALANPALLAHVPRQAIRISLGKHGVGRILPQSEVQAQMIEHAQRGAVVVRLKGGDPAIFGRLSEELEALRAAGIPCEVVPGLTAGLAAGSTTGVLLTHRAAASAVALVTGREDDNKLAPPLDYSALAQFPGTLVFYMGVTTAAAWSRALIVGGKSPDTPVLVVRRCTWSDQQTWTTTLAELPTTIAAHGIRPPVIFIVGELASSEQLDLSMLRPLSGRRILVTRPRQQCDELNQWLGDLGADCLIQPAIEIGPPSDFDPMDSAIRRLADFTWLVFSSANGVDAFVARLQHLGLDGRALAGIKLAVIGRGTAEQLSSHFLNADLVPNEFRAESLAESLLPEARGKRVLLIRASRGREVLAETLEAGGVDVSQVVAYSSNDITTLDPEIAAELARCPPDWITVTSSAIAHSLVHLLGPRLLQTKLASISPVTTATLAGLGFQVAAEAHEYTAAGLVEAILEYERAAPNLS